MIEMALWVIVPLAAGFVLASQYQNKWARNIGLGLMTIGVLALVGVVLRILGIDWRELR
jgi:membrane protein DedA with SNARE-associated domain